jgi:hypothetical protein
MMAASSGVKYSNGSERCSTTTQTLTKRTEVNSPMAKDQPIIVGKLPDINSRFGRWTVISAPRHRSPGKKIRIYRLCLCDCGQQREVLQQNLLNGGSQSCGCLSREVARIGVWRLIESSITHGESGSAITPEYRAWRGMLTRCENPTSRGFKWWGGRGIKICERWHTYENFLADMGRRPSPKHSLDRFPDNNGHYQPGNCRWATSKEQCRNKTSNRLVTVNGKTCSVSEWAEVVGINRNTLSCRLLSLGWNGTDAVLTPVETKSTR